jgi:hypothetical protein
MAPFHNASYLNRRLRTDAYYYWGVFVYILKPGTGDRFDSTLLAQDYFWLPPDTPFGNLSAKFFSIGMRLGHVNTRLDEAYSYWWVWKRTQLTPQPTDADIVTGGTSLKLHLFATEEAVAGMRRCADELVATIWYLEKYIEDGTYPSEIKIDMIGGAVRKCQPASILTDHKDFLDFLNRLSNALKHSFADSDSTLIGNDQPRATAINYEHNKIKADDADPKLIYAPLGELVTTFNEFLADCFARLKELSDEIMPKMEVRPVNPKRMRRSIYSYRRRVAHPRPPFIHVRH